MSVPSGSSSPNKDFQFTGQISDSKVVVQGTSNNTFNYYVERRVSGFKKPGVHAVGEEREFEKWAKCVETLGQTNPEDDRKTLISSHQLGNGTAWESILGNPVFQRWRSGDDLDPSLIWVCSGASTGKTRLAVFVTNHLETSNLDPKDRVLYFFCKNEKGYNTAASILKGLIVSLYNQDEPLGKYLYEQYCIQEGPFQDHNVEALWRVFEQMVENSEAKRIYCVIDGIDQCKDMMLQQFLHKVNWIFRRRNKEQSPESNSSPGNDPLHTPTDPMLQSTIARKLRMMILTRERDTVLEELRPFPKLPLSINTEMESLIETKVQRVSTICSKNKDPSEEMIEIIDRILNSGPDQSFLFVGLVSERIEGMTLKQLREYEKSAPKTVEDFHCQTLGKVPPKHRQAVLAILKWVALAERPLTALQLTKAVKYSLSKSFSRKSLKKAMDMCYGLVTDIIEDKRHVFVLGQGATEILFGIQSPLLDNKQLKEFVLDRSNVHSELANACIAYLQESANLEKSRKVRLRKSDRLKKADRIFFEKHPFLEYAMVNWTHHAKLGNLEKTKYDVPFFEDKLPRRRLWWESYWISHGQTFAWKWIVPGNFSLLHLAAFFDIVPLARHVYENGQLERFLGAEDHQGMKPINWATENSSTGMVQFLLEQGDFDDETLRQAARTGDISILRMLLENKRRRNYGHRPLAR